jgi:DNA-directed RNA polymerase specialized sigma24 family protein
MTAQQSSVQPRALTEPREALLAALPAVEQLLADPALTSLERSAKERNRARREAAGHIRALVAEVIRGVYAAAALPLTERESRELLADAHDFVVARVEVVCEQMVATDPPEDVRQELEWLLLVLWRKAVRELRGGTLTADENRAFGPLVQMYKADLVRCVCRRLRWAGRHRAGATDSAVAQSVWASLIKRHVDELPLISEEQNAPQFDPDSAWGLLAALAERHCDKWNQRGHRRPVDFVDPTDGDAAGAAVAAPVEDAVLTRACLDLLRSVENPSADPAGPTTPTDLGVVTELCRHLTEVERQVLLLKLTKYTAAEIAEVLNVSSAQVNYTWARIKDKLRPMAA